MLVLHTSDWHLGHELYGNDRTPEFAAMLLQMRRIAADRKPDVFLISGDIFDTALPGNAVQQFFTNAIVELHLAHPGMVIVMTSGNHDSATRHEIFRNPWRALNVYALGTIDTSDLSRNIITIPGKGHIVAVPYINDRMMPENLYQRLFDLVPDDGLPIVLSAHTTVKGARFDGHRQIIDDETDIVGNIKAVNIEDIPAGYDYLALGHIHKAQFIHSGRHHSVRYCGSPLPISFDEPTDHSVSLVTINRRGDEPDIEVIPIENCKPLITIPYDSAFRPWNEVMELLLKHKCRGEEYIRMNVLLTEPLPDDRNAQIGEVTKNKSCTVCHINAKRPEVTGNSRQFTRTVREFQETDPLEIAKEYAAFNRTPLSSELVDLFNQVYSEIVSDR